MKATGAVYPIGWRFFALLLAGAAVHVIRERLARFSAARCACGKYGHG